MSNQFRAAVLSGKTPGKPDKTLADKPARDGERDDLSKVETARSEPRSQNHRWSDRHRLQDETATVRYAGDDHEVELINLSGGGAMIRGNFEARLWDKLELVLGDGDEASVECAVRWVRRDRIGLEFAHETRIRCDSRSRDKLLRDVIRRSFPEIAGDEVVDEDDEMPVVAEPANEEAQRTQRRHPLIWMADIPFDHSVERVRIRNISETGAMIETGKTFPIGVELMLDMGEAGQHFGKLVWARGDQYGLAFTRPFDIAVLAKSKPAVAPQRWAQPSYLRQDASKVSPWAEHWNRQSIEDLKESLGGYLGR